MVKDDVYQPNEIAWHDVPLKLGEMQFLHAQIDDTASRLEELRDFINNFKFCKFTI